MRKRYKICAGNAAKALQARLIPALVHAAPVDVTGAACDFSPPDAVHPRVQPEPETPHSERHRAGLQRARDDPRDPAARREPPRGRRSWSSSTTARRTAPASPARRAGRGLAVAARVEPSAAAHRAAAAPGEPGQGCGAAHRLRGRHCDIFLTQDADLEYDPADYEKLMSPILRRSRRRRLRQAASPAIRGACCSSGTRSATRCSPRCRTCSVT